MQQAGNFILVPHLALSAADCLLKLGRTRGWCMAVQALRRAGSRAGLADWSVAAGTKSTCRVRLQSEREPLDFWWLLLCM
jgi:hypothetical protein